MCHIKSLYFVGVLLAIAIGYDPINVRFVTCALLLSRFPISWMMMVFSSVRMWATGVVRGAASDQPPPRVNCFFNASTTIIIVDAVEDVDEDGDGDLDDCSATGCWLLCVKFSRVVNCFGKFKVKAIFLNSMF